MKGLRRKTRQGPKMQLHRIMVIGDSRAGKTSLIIRFILQCFVEDYDPTISDSWVRQCRIDDQLVFLELLDTVPDSDYWETFYSRDLRTMDGVLLAYPINSRVAFDNLDKWVQTIVRITGKRHFPMVIIATKGDMEHDREVLSIEGQEFASEVQVPHFDTSAKLGVNIEPAVEKLVRLIRVDKENSSGMVTNDIDLNRNSRHSRPERGCIIL
ncbi:P-loop containing nucleoside triphosphate hydrolase protein [Serendipita vermifera]|nr:P-loop containing nucleoside triphosphate hydrolase protein [Serendipita vermifera]